MRENEMMPRAWFGRKRIGWGLRPLSWQGWALTGLYILLALTLSVGLAHHRLLLAVVVAALTAAYVAVAVATSGGRC